MRSNSFAGPGTRLRQSAARRRAGRRCVRASRAGRARCSERRPSRGSTQRRERAATSVARVPLFFPRVTVVLVAVALPEARLVLGPQLDAADPLRALPEVEVRNEQPRGPAVLGVERFTPKLVRDPGFPLTEVLEREVRRVAAVTEREHVFGARVDPVEQCVERDAGPTRVQLRPLRDAMDVDGHRLGRQRAELVPAPARSSSTAPRIAKLQFSSGACGVGPADSTGKSSVTYCPGGTRDGSMSTRRLPWNPRENVIEQQLTP